MLLHFFTSKFAAAALLALVVCCSYSCLLTATSSSAPATNADFPQLLHVNLHRPTYIDAEWVIQARDVGFSGFFFEFLGLSSSIRKYLPFMKYSKSNFHTSSDEPLNYRNPDYLFGNLFDKEKSDLQYISSSYLDKSSSYYDASLPNFMFIKPIAGVQTRTSTSVVSNFCANASIYQTSSGAGFRSETSPLSRGRIDIVIDNDPSSSSSPFSTVAHINCCEWCSQLTPICSAFSYSKSSQRCHLYGSYKKPELAIPQVDVNSAGPPDVLVGDLVANKLARVYSPPKVVIFHGQTCIFRNDTVLGSKRDVGIINIGRFMVERAGLKGGMNLFDFSMLACAAAMDEIWVPTDEHKRLFEELGKMSGYIIPSVHVVPEAVDTTLFDPSLVKESSNYNNDNSNDDVNDSQVGRRFTKLSCRSKLSFHSFYSENKCLDDSSKQRAVIVDEQGQQSSVHYQNNKDQNSIESVFEFLSIFKWESRKGWDSLLASYWAAFTKDDPVVLKIITFVPKDSPEYVSKGQTDIPAMMNSLAKSKFGRDSFESLAKVIIIDIKEIAPLSRSDFRNIYYRADAFVIATRGEGWGLPIAEAMAMELPVIVTNCLGPSHYANDSNAYLIPVVPGEIDNLGYVTPDSTALTSIFRQVVIDSTSTTGPAAIRGANARKTMQDFSPDLVVNAMIARFKSLYNLRGWSI